MNECLDRINELLAASTADLVTQEDLATGSRMAEVAVRAEEKLIVSNVEA